MKRKARFDGLLLLIVVMMVLAGTLMVFSSSFYYALQRYGDQYHFFKNELTWACVGFAGMFVTARIPYPTWRKLAWPLLILTLIGLVIVLTPLSHPINGARRWIEIGSITFMPGELAKFAVVLFMSTQLSRENKKVVTIKDLAPYLIVLGLVFALILKQPNFSTGMTILVVGFILLFIAELPLFWCGFLGTVLGAGAVGLIFVESYRLQRFLTFLDPFDHPSKEGYQVVQSLYAIGSGGFFGVGLGQSIQNKLYIPEPQNDFIFATIGEEFGYLGTTVVVLFYAGLIWRGVKIAINARDRFGFFLAAGITATIGFQALINLAVATSSMPVTGVPLPFISFGGNNLALLMGQIGILLNISKYSLNGESKS